MKTVTKTKTDEQDNSEVDLQITLSVAAFQNTQDS